MMCDIMDDEEDTRMMLLMPSSPCGSKRTLLRPMGDTNGGGAMKKAKMLRQVTDDISTPTTTSTSTCIADPTSTAVDGPQAIIRTVMETKELVLLEARCPTSGNHRTKHFRISSPFHHHRRIQIPSYPTETPPSLTLTAKHVIPSQDTPVIIYCRSGNGYYSGTAKSILVQLGYTTVFNAGNFEYLGWLQHALTMSSS